MSYLSSVKKQTGHSNTINTTSDTEHCHMKIEYVKRKMLSRAQRSVHLSSKRYSLYKH